MPVGAGPPWIARLSVHTLPMQWLVTQLHIVYQKSLRMHLSCVNGAAVFPACHISLIFVVTSPLSTRLLVSPTFAQVGHSWFAFSPHGLAPVLEVLTCPSRISFIPISVVWVSMESKARHCRGGTGRWLHWSCYQRALGVTQGALSDDRLAQCRQHKLLSSTCDIWMQRAHGFARGKVQFVRESNRCRSEIGEKHWGTQWYHFYKHTFLRLEITISVALTSASEVFKQLILLVLNEHFPSGCTFTAVF